MTRKITQFEEIPLNKIIVSEFNVRKDFNAGSEDSNLEDLAKSINEKGLLSPIIVTKKNDDYELIAGQRRYFACQLLGWKKIPSIVKEDLKETDARIISLIENVHRSDLHPLDKGRAYQQLYDEFDTYSEVSKETGVSIPTIRRYMFLLKLAPSIQILLTTSDGPAGVCTLSLLAEMFPNFMEQEYVLKLIKGFKQQVQEKILKNSEGDINKIEELVELAQEGYFNTVICKGLESCPYIPDECREKILEIIEAHKNQDNCINSILEMPTKN